MDSYINREGRAWEDNIPHRTFKVLKFRPSWMQWAIMQLPAFLLLAALIWLPDYLDYEIPEKYSEFPHYAILLVVVWLCCKAASWACLEYIISGEQLIYRHGVLFHASDFMELYRVVDYQESRTPMQIVFGLKTVHIYSGDKTLPCLKLLGVKSNVDILGEIRDRVEYNKRRRGVYEITNRQ